MGASFFLVDLEKRKKNETKHLVGPDSVTWTIIYHRWGPKVIFWIASGQGPGLIEIRLFICSLLLISFFVPIHLVFGLFLCTSSNLYLKKSMLLITKNFCNGEIQPEKSLVEFTTNLSIATTEPHLTFTNIFKCTIKHASKIIFEQVSYFASLELHLIKIREK